MYRERAPSGTRFFVLSTLKEGLHRLWVRLLPGYSNDSSCSSFSGFAGKDAIRRVSVEYKERPTGFGDGVKSNQREIR